VEKQRGKVDDALTRLNTMLDEDEHDSDCTLRCVTEWCFQEHTCPVCRADGEV